MARDLEADRNTAQKLLWWLLALATTTLLAVGGSALSDVKNTTRSQEEEHKDYDHRLTRLETNYDNIEKSLSRIETAIGTKQDKKESK